ncbi:exonuclease SbcC [Shewanella sairae]|uniref:Exonuclease SbcC n=1 Tax=Shewanella sairae TaxID=190310 RepID=A0ABQ4P5W4_9GAMM|nr:ATPase, T2SS/T4P/T4SS family [Shewanella sairae]MCL1130492.1 Flp pilus assembly complex ATPase component TadA [Shewanella sairae]GIU42909.1 exonuclease SbcC [Shewanella sairae]
MSNAVLSSELLLDAEELSNKDILMDPQLIQLCLDDGSSYVTIEGEVKTSDPKMAPKLDEIVQFVKAMPNMTGKEVRISKTTQEQVDIVIEIMTKSTPQERDESANSELAVFFAAICQTAVNESASDVHIEVYKEQTRFLMRVDGRREVMKRLCNEHSVLHQPRSVGVSLASYMFSTLGGQDIKLRDPANDRFSILLKHPTKGESLFEWRVALIPLNHGVKLTLRCVTSDELSLEQMDLPSSYVAILKEIVAKRGGAIVVCGPMGSGKSSLVTALIATIDRIARSVHSLEDPVEFEQEGVCKTTVEPNKEIKVGEGRYRDYAFYAKETLRHDVDVSVLGEVRDHAAAKEFCRKAETGGLAITTLHTNSALGVPQTFTEHLGIPAAVVAAPGLMLMFVHQKLVRKLCQCALPLNGAQSVYEECGLTLEFASKQQALTTLLKEGASHSKVRNPKGCDCCKGKGEKGRLVVMEIIVIDDADRQFIASNKPLDWKEYLNTLNWPDIRVHTLSRIKNGQVDIASASEQVDGLLPKDAKTIYRSMRGELAQ